MRQTASVSEFSLKVWITSIITAPPLIILGYIPGRHFHHNASFLLMTFVGYIVVGTIFSFPSFLLLRFATKSIIKQDWTPVFKKALLLLIGLFLAFAPFPCYAGNYKDLLYFKYEIAAYTLTIAAGILIYRLPAYSKTSHANG